MKILIAEGAVTDDLVRKSGVKHTTLMKIAKASGVPIEDLVK